MPKSDAPLRIDLPSPSGERAPVLRIGLVVALSFAVGVAWPKLAGLRLGPDVPGGKNAAKALAAEPAAASAEPVAAPSYEAPGLPPASNKQRVVVGKASVVICKDDKGKPLERCSPVALDKAVGPKLRDVAKCPSALGLEGPLDLVLKVDFDKSSIGVVEGDKSSLPSSTVRGVLRCAASELERIELDRLRHEAKRVSLGYRLVFYPPGKAIELDEPKAAAGAEDTAEAETGLGSATVRWEKALLRETPKDGKVVARVPQGARVTVVEQREDWFKVTHRDKKGWVYRQAIGR